MPKMSKVDFMLGILTSLIATILFELRYLLVIRPAKQAITIMAKAWSITTPSLKFNLLGILCISLMCVGFFNVSTVTVFAPSQPSQNTFPPSQAWQDHNAVVRLDGSWEVKIQRLPYSSFEITDENSIRQRPVLR
jgi:hypothetical protein